MRGLCPHPAEGWETRRKVILYSLLPPAAPVSTERGQQPGRLRYLIVKISKIGAGEGIRTLDPDLGKVVLYP